MDILKQVQKANQSAQEATAVLQANHGRLDKLPREVLQRISGMAGKSKTAWEDVEYSIESIIASR